MAAPFVEGLPLVDVDRVATIRFPVPSGSSRDVWDLARSPGGEVYAAVSPIHEPGTPQLYRFDVARKAMELVFDLSELTILPRKGIPANKIHTSMAFADDNTLFLVSHTTAAAPGHARWAPLACYHDLYDGFAGSHLLRVDLRRGDARCLGIPVPRESLWGGSCYLPETGEYMAIGLVRGHLYSIRVGDLSVMDLGFVGRGCRLFRDSRGRAYGISPSGRRARAILYRYDPARGAIEPLDVELPRSRGASLAFAQPGPDGRIYLARNFYDPFWNLDEVVDDESTDHLFAFDPDSEALRGSRLCVPRSARPGPPPDAEDSPPHRRRPCVSRGRLPAGRRRPAPAVRAHAAPVDGRAPRRLGHALPGRVALGTRERRGRPLLRGASSRACTRTRLPTASRLLPARLCIGRSPRAARRHRVPDAGGTYNASPVASDGHLYLAHADGIVYVVRAGRQFELVAANPMGEALMATPAMAQGLLIVRTRHHVVAVEGT